MLDFNVFTFNSASFPAPTRCSSAPATGCASGSRTSAWIRTHSHSWPQVLRHWHRRRTDPAVGVGSENTVNIPVGVTRDIELVADNPGDWAFHCHKSHHDAPLAPGILAGFNLLTVLTTEWNDEPERASRPFTRNRSGMVLGEGAWIYVLEEFERAKNRGANIYAEITGYGSTCDAYHRVRLQEGGDEPARAMALAMDDARVNASQIDYVNLHGTSTMLNDRIETNALKLALNSNSHRIPMSATKSQVGHPQGASGAAGLGAALCAMNTA